MTWKPEAVFSFASPLYTPLPPTTTAQTKSGIAIQERRMCSSRQCT